MCIVVVEVGVEMVVFGMWVVVVGKGFVVAFEVAALVVVAVVAGSRSVASRSARCH